MSDPAIATHLRQMIAVLEQERQALAALDLDALIATSHEKLAMCHLLAGSASLAGDDECRALAESARTLNETNRRVRNLLAAQVAARIDALTGQGQSYSTSRAA